MRRKLDYSEEFVSKAQQFAGMVNCWMDLIRLLPDSPWGIDEMKRIRDRLMELCITAISLPDPDELEYEDLEDTDRRNRRIEKDIMFEDRYRHYYSLFWPYDGIGDSKEEPEVPVMSDLVDDMYGICADLLYGLEYYDAGIIHRAVFLWRLSYLSHWGEHTIQVVYAMDHAIREHMNDDDMGKYEDPADAMYYPSIPLEEIDSHFVACVEMEDTKLSYSYPKWSSNRSKKTVKTVYDPCPPGFCVPTETLWTLVAAKIGESSSSTNLGQGLNGKSFTPNAGNTVFIYGPGYRNNTGALSVGSSNTLPLSYTSTYRNIYASSGKTLWFNCIYTMISYYCTSSTSEDQAQNVRPVKED